ncbi:MAG: transcription antitermination factor NusB [Thermoguttaceae bacterium]|nr:transcription antitermination factor NusB [Thermoguttaceae bacterium]
MSDKKKKIKPNTIGRALALQALYQQELNPQDSLENDWRELYDCCCEETQASLTDEELANAIKYAQRLFEGTTTRLREIDDLLNKALDKRTLKQTTVVDRNILRVAAYEMRFVKTPKAIVISEAIELGKKFGESSSQAFINGVLDQIDGVPLDNSTFAVVETSSPEDKGMV